MQVGKIEETKSTLSLSTENNKLTNPKTVMINHVSTDKQDIKIFQDSVFSVDIYKGEKLITSNINNLETVPVVKNSVVSINKSSPLSTEIDISREKLQLDYGNYTLSFSSNLVKDENKATIKIDVTYEKNGTYYTSLYQEVPGTKGLTLYFPTENNDALIPVTRFLVENNSLTRMSLDELKKGPLNPGMKTFVGMVNDITYNDGYVVIDLPSSYQMYNKDATIGKLSHDSIVKSIFAVKRYWPIYSISFTVDYKKANTYFGGINTSNAIPDTNNNYSIYRAYVLNKRYYLFDQKIDFSKAGIKIGDSLVENAKKLFDAMKNSDYAYGVNTVPGDVLINSITMQKSTLVLDFNDKFLNAYKGEDDLKLMMLHSLVYTFTSIPEIDSIKITVNNKGLTNFIEGKIITGPLYAPKFINPEVVK